MKMNEGRIRITANTHGRLYEYIYVKGEVFLYIDKRFQRKYTGKEAEQLWKSVS